MDNDLITGRQILSKLPLFLSRLPRSVKGLKMASRTQEQGQGLGWAVERATKLNPNGIAILSDDRRVTYCDFNAWANRCAHYFSAQGAKRGDVVAVFMENRVEYLVILAALAKLGVTAALINSDLRKENLIHVFKLAKAKAVVIGEELIPAYDDIKSNLDFTDEQQLFWADTDTLIDEGSTPEGYVNLAKVISSQVDQNPAETNLVSPTDTCFLIYTSGTTGLSKAAIVSHGRFMTAFGGVGYGTVGLDTNDVIYVTLPFYHASGIVICWGAALAAGAGFALRRKFSASQFWDDVQKYQATCFGYVGEVARYLLNQPVRDAEKNNPVTKVVGNGMRLDIWSEFKSRFEIDTVYELYAASEGNIGFSNMLNFDRTVGLCPNEYAIVNYDAESALPERDSKGFARKVNKGEVGLLLGKITSDSPFDGYTEKDKTDTKIIRNIFTKGDAWFNTGDVLRDIGFRHAQFIDRLGDTFRWKGQNVSTMEVEGVINSFSLIEESVVYGVEVPNTEGRAGMAAIKLSDNKDDNSIAQLYEYLETRLPEYAVPLFIRILDNMDTTGTFKYKKTDLKKDGFQDESSQNTLFFQDRESKKYIAMTDEIQSAIQCGAIRL